METFLNWEDRIKYAAGRLREEKEEEKDAGG